MSQSKQSKSKAATAEKAPEPKTFEWRGLTLALPDTLPGTLLFDFAGLDDLAAGRSLAPFLGILRSLLGDEQVYAIRQKVAEDGISLEDVFPEIEGLLNSILEQYGMGLGESSASEVS